MTVCRIPKSSITTITAPLMRCRLRLPILRWCSTRNAPPWTGSSATATGRWQRCKKRRWSSSLTGQSFGTLFSNMDAKWLKGYERSTLYGETLELMDYSPEIDTHLKVICFPTFKGHCGCILFDVDKIWFEQHSEDSAKTLARYYAKLPNNK